mmetsp:Transcript_55026/g.163833  ORF Transcript_55026/g.163833 Transcript_55026/m.163833 type:complete len:223 (-) Transcript_55026:31-699(-)
MAERAHRELTAGAVTREDRLRVVAPPPAKDKAGPGRAPAQDLLEEAQELLEEVALHLALAPLPPVRPLPRAEDHEALRYARPHGLRAVHGHPGDGRVALDARGVPGHGQLRIKRNHEVPELGGPRAALEAAPDLGSAGRLRHLVARLAAADDFVCLEGQDHCIEVGAPDLGRHVCELRSVAQLSPGCRLPLPLDLPATRARIPAADVGRAVDVDGQPLAPGG